MSDDIDGSIGHFSKCASCDEIKREDGDYWFHDCEHCDDRICDDCSKLCEECEEWICKHHDMTLN